LVLSKQQVDVSVSSQCGSALGVVAVAAAAARDAPAPYVLGLAHADREPRGLCVLDQSVFVALFPAYYALSSLGTPFLFLYLDS
jgi:hypothetical protein